ncbi:hypothetical protein [Paenibacillus jiagnxiensis]|uniref:hypothetical protein n=1 Tax=Paenibacillus jiagnxiensis TaxID=3228926 RepID=UPI0038D4D7C4
MRIIQYERNKKSLNQIMSIEDYPCDWAITIAFYSALHLVEYHLFKVDQKNRIRRSNEKENHTERNREVVKELKLGHEVAHAYRALYNESRAARYDCIPIKKSRVQTALKNLDIIVHQLESVN